MTTNTITEAQAKALDKRVRAAATKADNAVFALGELIAEAQAGKIHKLLGFASWDAYLVDVVSTNCPKLGKGDSRVNMVQLLKGAGLTVRQIAKATNTSLGTVSRDANAEEGETEAKKAPRSPLAVSLEALELIAKREYSDEERAELVAALKATATKLAAKNHPAGKKAA